MDDWLSRTAFRPGENLWLIVALSRMSMTTRVCRQQDQSSAATLEPGFRAGVSCLVQVYGTTMKPARILNVV